MIGESVLDLLRAEGYAVDWVKDGDLADATLAIQTYDLVLLDLGLPKRDGLEVLRQLRARKDRTPVLIATARDALEQRVRGGWFGLALGDALLLGRRRQRQGLPRSKNVSCTEFP